THVPFWPTPPLQPDWNRMLTSDPYDAEPLRRALARTPEWTDMGVGYVRAVGYFFDTLASYLRAHARDPLVIVVLGDHQPAANVSGEGASWDVPVHVIASEPALLDSLEGHGFTRGLSPQRHTSGAMNELAGWLRQAFGSAPEG